MSILVSFSINSSCCLSFHLPIIRKELASVLSFSKLQQESERLKKINSVKIGSAMVLSFQVTRQYGSNEFWTDG